MSQPWSEGCIYHRDDDARAFITEYFGRDGGSILWIGGAGFDPRSTYVPTLLKEAKASAKGILIREDRPRPHSALLDLADANEAALAALFASSQQLVVPVFSEDETSVTGGRKAVAELARQDLAGITDILLDFTALSVGISFPIARWLYDTAKDNAAFPNVHVLATSSAAGAANDTSPAAELLDRPQMVVGFDGDLGIDGSASRARLWLPLLAHGKQQAMRIIQSNIRLDEICPILPFPSASPRMVEQLVEGYTEQLRDTWNVDRRDFLYAAEDDPLDLYQTILRIDRSRGLTYAVTGGSVTLLSPLGTKVMAIGALMAALALDLPVVYVETQRYAVGGRPQPSGVVHVWLTGSAYH